MVLFTDQQVRLLVFLYPRSVIVQHAVFAHASLGNQDDLFVDCPPPN